MKDYDVLERFQSENVKEGSNTTSKRPLPGNGADWKKLQSLLAQLRKAANHPFLFPGAEDSSQILVSDVIVEELVTS